MRKVIRVDIVVNDSIPTSLQQGITDWPRGLVTSLDLVTSLVMASYNDNVEITITSIEDLS